MLWENAPCSETASNSDGQGISVFVRDGNQVFDTYSADGVGADVMLSTYRFLDLAPAGRQQYVNQWPLHDTYGQPGGRVHQPGWPESPGNRIRAARRIPARRGI